MTTRHLMAVLVALGASACTDPAGEVVSVAAASSLRNVLEAAGRDFEATHPDLRLELAYEASSTIARQIEAGAGFDVFLSADAVNLERAGERLDPETRRSFLSNRMVLVASPGRAGDVRALADLVGGEGNIAVAMSAVPAGRYARQLLEERELLQGLEPRFVQARNARATLALVASGAADFGLVYLSDQLVATDVELLWTAPTGEPPIAYVGAAVEGAGPGARGFLDWLSADAFQSAAAEQGFTPYRP